MKPVTFTCRETLALAPEAIAAQILDVANWPTFEGYGPLPGVRSAEFEVETAEVVGSRVRVVNTDGSTHVEDVVEWQTDRRLVLRMSEFSPPLSRLTDRFEEVWAFERDGERTNVTRTFSLRPKSAVARLPLLLISLLLRRAVERHLRRMREQVSVTPSLPPRCSPRLSATISAVWFSGRISSRGFVPDFWPR